jgi:hypothetical protein
MGSSNFYKLFHGILVSIETIPPRMGLYCEESTAYVIDKNGLRLEISNFIGDDSFRNILDEIQNMEPYEIIERMSQPKESGVNLIQKTIPPIHSMTRDLNPNKCSVDSLIRGLNPNTSDIPNGPGTLLFFKKKAG